MTLEESKFIPAECRRCRKVIFTGTYCGLPWRVDLGATAAEARVLDHYGHGVLVLALRHTGLWPADYHPDRQPTPNTYLAVAHVCGSAHAQQLQEAR